MQQRIRAFLDKDCGQGATLSEINRAQEQLGVTFPESYRLFLQDFGWARFSHEELYGIGKDVPMHLDLVRNTLAERNQMHPQLPHALVPIMNDGAGNHYCLRSSDKESPVVFWDHDLGDGQQPEIIAPTFVQWLLELLDDLTP